MEDLGDDRCPGNHISRLRFRVNGIEVPHDVGAETESHVILVTRSEISFRTYGTSCFKISCLVAMCPGLGSLYIRRRTLTSVEALLDSCFNKLGSCFMKPRCKVLVEVLLNLSRQTHRLSIMPSLAPYRH